MLFSACSSDTPVENQTKFPTEKYPSYVVDMANDGLISDTEKDWWLGIPIVENFAEDTKTAHFNQQKYTVTYRDSIFSGYSHIQINRYCNDEVILSFASTDGSFKGIHYQNLFDADYFIKTELPNPYESACSMAAAIASQYIQVEAYELEETIIEVPSEEIAPNLTLYTFHYIKYVGDFKTSDDLYIQITSKGDLRTIKIGDIGCFDRVTAAQINTSALDQSLHARLKDLYSDIGSYSYEIVNQTMAYSPDNQLTIVSEIELDIITKTGDKYITGVVLSTIIV
jgi:hypothetical protein